MTCTCLPWFLASLRYALKYDTFANRGLKPTALAILWIVVLMYQPLHKKKTFAAYCWVVLQTNAADIGPSTT
jgi:hypothetical protein